MAENMKVDLEMNQLAKLATSRKEVRIYLRNGYQIVGVITDYDDNVIMVKTAKKDWMIYRQMMASILLREDTEEKNR